MHYITITGKDFEEALKKGQEQYGPSLRVHSRRDIIAKGGFLGLRKNNSIELTCYLASEIEEVKEPSTTEEEVVLDDNQLTEEQKLLDHGRNILKLNGFSNQFSEATLTLLEPLLENTNNQLPSINEFELMLVDKIVALVKIDSESQLHPPPTLVILGPSAMGKSSSASKIGALYTLQEDPNFFRKVEFIGVDTAFRRSVGLLAESSEKFELPYSRAINKDDLAVLLARNSDENRLTIIDTAGFSAKESHKLEHLRDVLKVVNLDDSKFVLALSATTKMEDLKAIVKRYSVFPISSVIITNIDETENIGTILSVCYENELSLLFFSDGKRIPEDLHKASAAKMLSFLKGLNLDFNALWANQFGSYSTNVE